jgi:hypothetical protein
MSGHDIWDDDRLDGAEFRAKKETYFRATGLGRVALGR